MRLQAAPRWHVGPGRRVIGKHLDYLANSHLADLLSQHDDRLRAFLAECVEAQRWYVGRRQTSGLIADQLITSGPARSFICARRATLLRLLCRARAATQSAHDFGKDVEEALHRVVGCVPWQGYPHIAVGDGAHRCEDMARLLGVVRAGAA